MESSVRSPVRHSGGGESAGTPDWGMGDNFAWYSLQIEADFDRFVRAFYEGCLIQFVSDGEKLVRHFPILSMCKQNEYEGPMLELVPGR